MNILWPIALLAIVSGAIFFYWRLKRDGRLAEKLFQANATLKEVGDVADVRHVIVNATPTERERLLDKWRKRDVPSA